MPIHTRSVGSLLLILGAIGLCAPNARGMDHVTFRRGGELEYVDGRVTLQAQDGGLVFLGRDGLIWKILPTEIVKRTLDDAPFRAYPKDELVKRTLADLPKGFSAYQTEHYMICYNGSKSYAVWCGALFERLYMAFRNAWSRQGFAMTKPEFPLVAVVFADKASYVQYAEKTLGDAADSIIGYYEPETTNRTIMYDLTAVEGAAAPRGGPGTRISHFLTSPNAPGAVSTIVHEATHQIAFNSGLHQRLSDCPKWFSEGIAMYCETPDLHGNKGWAGIGAVNRVRLAQFQQFQQQRRPVKSLKSLIVDDERLINADRVIDAYAESWALTYFLLHKHPKEYIAYLKDLSRKQPLKKDGPATRLAEFEKRFGRLDALETEFLNYMERSVR
jgi:hypothetical protein